MVKAQPYIVSNALHQNEKRGRTRKHVEDQSTKTTSSSGILTLLALSGAYNNNEESDSEGLYGSDKDSVSSFSRNNGKARITGSTEKMDDTEKTAGGGTHNITPPSTPTKGKKGKRTNNKGRKRAATTNSSRTLIRCPHKGYVRIDAPLWLIT